MSAWRLFVTKSSRAFAGIEGSPRSRYRIVGVPLDSTTTYRPGARFGPDAVRVAAAALESNSAFVKGVYLEDAAPYDEGDVVVPVGDVAETLRRVEAVVRGLRDEGGIPILIGGEHTITLGALRALSDAEPCVVMFDAHYDLRPDYLGVRVSHATFMRRALEQAKVRDLVYVGVRAYAREEEQYASDRGFLTFKAPLDFMTLGPANISSAISQRLSKCGSVYITVDMDVFDPSYAPGVGNPEPMGPSPYEVLTIINRLVDGRLAGMDVVETDPTHDPSGITAALAAKVIIEAIAKHFSTAARQG